MANGAGTVADIWSPKDRALATTLFSIGPFSKSPVYTCSDVLIVLQSSVGPGRSPVSSKLRALTLRRIVIGPVVGGYVSDSRLTWRFNFWIMFIMAAVLFVAGILNMSESVRLESFLNLILQ